jgi:toxin ParE1/3/4
MTKPIYRLSCAAEADLLEIWSYVFEQAGSERIAAGVISEIVSVFDSLLQFPNMGRTRDDLGASYRSVPRGKYAVFYRLIPAGIEISRIMHGARDIDFGDLPILD